MHRFPTMNIITIYYRHVLKKRKASKNKNKRIDIKVKLGQKSDNLIQ